MHTLRFARRLSALFAATVACAALVIGIRLAFELPVPTGPFPVGTIAVTLARPPEPGEVVPGTYVVQIWYPGRASNGGAPYGTGRPGLKRWIYSRLIRTSASAGTAFARGAAAAPLIVYAAGWGDERTANTALAEELASHGFVVAAFADSSFDEPPLRRLAGEARFSSAAAYDATLKIGAAKLVYEARRASEVLDMLTRLDKADPSGRFRDRLDVERAATLGYSFGGAVALEACRIDRRFRAAMNLDGWLFDAANGYRGGVPYFLVSDRSSSPGVAELNSTDPVLRYTSHFTVLDEARQDAVLRRGGYALRIAGADHLSFTDVPLYALRHRFRPGAVDPRELGSTVREYAVAFFGLVFHATPSELLEPGERREPTLTLERWPAAREL